MLEALRQMRANPEYRRDLFIIRGASGSGKSSLLRAGVIPRLRREASAWLPLRAFRPGADPLLNFADALARTLKDCRKAEDKGVIRDRLRDAWNKAPRTADGPTLAGQRKLKEALEAEDTELRASSGRDAATILLSVYRAEEMAGAEGPGADALADYLRAVVGGMSRWQLVLTVRKDSFSGLKNHRRFKDLTTRTYDLSALPIYRFPSVIAGPARRYGITVEPTLIDALMTDAPTQETLPLLAFALERVMGDYPKTDTLTKDHYDRVGRLQGLISGAAERALRNINADAPLPSGAPSEDLAELGATTFVPALAQINEDGDVIRRVALWGRFNVRQQELLLRFEERRLVVRKGAGETGGRYNTDQSSGTADARGGEGDNRSIQADEGTVEVVHEALFREWKRLDSWIKSERPRLEALRTLERDAATWHRKSRDAAFLNHRDRRLMEAEALSSDDRYAKLLGAVEINHLEACRGAEQLAEQADRIKRQRTRRIVTILAVALFWGVTAWYYQKQLGDGIFWIDVWYHRLTPDRESALKPMATFKECSVCPKMIVVENGVFPMGSPDNEQNRSNTEGPQHDVTIARPFAVGKFDVTFAEWDACAAHGGCDQYMPHSSSGRRRMPVINVSWEFAKTYVAWLSEITGQNYRLLSEAEWEYVARAGSTTADYWGDRMENNKANCTGCGGQSSGATSVGLYEPNKFGLYDMAGNVSQWVEDCYHNSYEGAPAE